MNGVGGNDLAAKLDKSRAYIATSVGSGSKHGHIFVLRNVNGKWIENDKTGDKPVDQNKIGVAVAPKDKTKDELLVKAALEGGGKPGFCYQNVAGRDANSILNKADAKGDINNNNTKGGEDVGKPLDSSKEGVGSAYQFELTAIKEPELLKQMGFEFVGQNNNALHATTKSKLA